VLLFVSDERRGSHEYPHTSAQVCAHANPGTTAGSEGGTRLSTTVTRPGGGICSAHDSDAPCRRVGRDREPGDHHRPREGSRPRSSHARGSARRDRGLSRSYADMEAGAWTHLKVEVQGTEGRLYVNGATQPTLIVNDLKLGDTHGAIALWSHTFTDGYFANLRVR